MADAVHTGITMLLRRLPIPTPSLLHGEGGRRLLLGSALSLLFMVVSPAQQADPLSWQGKLSFHASAAYSPSSLVGTAAYSGFLQEIDFPREWGQGASGYGKRLG